MLLKKTTIISIKPTVIGLTLQCKRYPCYHHVLMLSKNVGGKFKILIGKIPNFWREMQMQMQI